MNKRHKWADVAIAFAEGKEIQFYQKVYDDWFDYTGTEFPGFNNNLVQWRIKPTEPKPTEPKPTEPVVRWLWANTVTRNTTSKMYTEQEALECGLAGYLKIEGTRTEFPVENENE